MKWVRRAIGLVILIALIGGGFYYYRAKRAQPIEVKTKEVESGSISAVVTASGKIEADRLVPVLSLASDEVEEVLVKEGELVEEDQDLIDFKRFSDLESPIDGRVTQIQVAAAQTVKMGTPVMTIADMKPAYVVANVDEADIGKVKVGQQANISLDAYPRASVEGKVVHIGLSSVVSEAGGIAFPVKIEVTLIKEAVLRLGMSADVDIVIKTYPQATLVSMSAVTTKDGRDVVYVIKDDRVEMRRVKLGIASEDYYQVLEGLKPGEEVAVKNLDKLKDEQVVRAGRGLRRRILQ